MVRTCQSTFDFEYSFSIHCVKGHRDSMELQRFKEAASKIKERSADIEVTCFSKCHFGHLRTVVFGGCGFFQL